jgi:glutamate carboxypeptidase
VLSAPGGAAEPPAALTAEELELKVVLEQRRGAMETTLQEWVDTNTGSFNLAGLQKFSVRLAERLKALGFEVESREGGEIQLPGEGKLRSGPLVVGRRPARVAAETAPSVLLVGHYDTVFEPDSPFQRFTRVPGDPTRAIGPGVSDMKGGLVILFEVLGALADTGDLDRAGWTVLLNADEEIGSLASRATIEAEARKAERGFVFESAQDGGAMVRSRAGVGQFQLRVQGVPAHAGSAHERGRSAIRALAAKILAIEALTDYDRGVTLNVGTVQGGSKRNIVPDVAEAAIDVRYRDPASGEQTRAKLEQIARAEDLPGTRAELIGSLHRPPKPQDAEVDRLIEEYDAIARALALDPPEPRHSGGGTDGSLMGAVGLATLDSVGAAGGRAHTEEEFVDLASLPARAANVAILLRRLVRAQLYAPPAGR